MRLSIDSVQRYDICLSAYIPEFTLFRTCCTCLSQLKYSSILNPRKLVELTCLIMTVSRKTYCLVTEPSATVADDTVQVESGTRESQETTVRSRGYGEFTLLQKLVKTFFIQNLQ